MESFDFMKLFLLPVAISITSKRRQLIGLTDVVFAEKLKCNRAPLLLAACGTPNQSEALLPFGNERIAARCAQGKELGTPSRQSNRAMTRAATPREYCARGSLGATFQALCRGMPRTRWASW